MTAGADRRNPSYRRSACRSGPGLSFRRLPPLEFWAQTPRRWIGLSRPGSPLTETGAIQHKRSSWRSRSSSRTVVPNPARRSPRSGYLPIQTRDASASSGTRATSRSLLAASDITATSGRSVIRASILRCNALLQFHATIRITSAESRVTRWRQKADRRCVSYSTGCAVSPFATSFAWGSRLPCPRHHRNPVGTKETTGEEPVADRGLGHTQ